MGFVVGSLVTTAQLGCERASVTMAWERHGLHLMLMMAMERWQVAGALCVLLMRLQRSQ